jgi:hypothetical protein
LPISELFLEGRFMVRNVFCLLLLALFAATVATTSAADNRATPAGQGARTRPASITRPSTGARTSMGYVYTINNDLNHNGIVVLNQRPDGSLAEIDGSPYSSGGKGISGETRLSP